MFFIVTLQGFGSSEGFGKNLPGSIHLVAVGSEREARELGLSKQSFINRICMMIYYYKLSSNFAGRVLWQASNCSRSGNGRNGTSRCFCLNQFNFAATSDFLLLYASTLIFQGFYY